MGRLEETVITGSYNFSKNAEERNSENLLIIKGNPDIAQAYLAEFDRIVTKAFHPIRL